VLLQSGLTERGISIVTAYFLNFGVLRSKRGTGVLFGYAN